MTARPVRRLLTVALLTGAATAAAAPSPALAGSSFFSRSSGTFATTSWLEIGKLPAAANAPGNAHFGDLWVELVGRNGARAFGTVYDVQCDEGTVPYNPGGGGGHGEPVPPEDGPCRLLGTRFIEGGSLTFTIDRKLTRARVTGTLSVGSGHGGPTAAPPIDVTWTGVGSTTTERSSGSYSDSSGTYRYSYSSTGRDASIAQGSKIGPMVFDDEPGESSTGRMGSYKQSDRGRTQ